MNHYRQNNLLLLFFEQLGGGSTYTFIDRGAKMAQCVISLKYYAYLSEETR
jgi:hypothetical protein